MAWKYGLVMMRGGTERSPRTQRISQRIGASAKDRKRWLHTSPRLTHSLKKRGEEESRL
jgi:hypothetical protein